MEGNSASSKRPMWRQLDALSVMTCTTFEGPTYMHIAQVTIYNTEMNYDTLQIVIDNVHVLCRKLGMFNKLPLRWLAECGGK